MTPDAASAFRCIQCNNNADQCNEKPQVQRERIPHTIAVALNLNHTTSSRGTTNVRTVDRVEAR
jgi:hypothetical protein